MEKENENGHDGYWLYRQNGTAGDFARAEVYPRLTGSILTAADWFLREEEIPEGEVFGVAYSEGRGLRLFCRETKTVTEQVRP